MKNKLLLKLTVAAIATIVAVTSAQAETSQYRKRGFFESLFGSSQRRQYRPRQQIPPWMQRNNDEISVFYGNGDQPQRRQPRSDIVYADPEPIPGLGMGNPPYVAPKMLLLADPSFSTMTASGEAAEAIRAELSSLKTHIRISQELRQPILDLYKTAGFKPFWQTAGAPSERAINVLAFAAKTSEDGLDPLSYLPVGLTSFENAAAQVGTDPQSLAQFDIAMTAAVLKLARHLSGGQFDPNRLSLYNDIKTEPVDANMALKVLAWSPFPEAYLHDLTPKNPAYALLKAELASLREKNPVTNVTKIAEGKTIKLGRSDPRLVNVRSRLETLGFGTVDTPGEPELLDSDLSDSLKKFQSFAKIKQSGILDAATVKSLNRDDTAANIQRLVENLERVRWLPKDMGKRFVFVNQAAYEVRVLDHGKQVWQSRVIVGKPLNQTSAFHDQMETVVFNPSWGVPQSIIVNEYVKKLIRDPGYLDREGFRVIDQRGKVVSSRSVNWGAYGSNPPYSVQQPPGLDNALGELKFLFPNKHDIYMHDTPARNLFAQSTRAFSHGCVRVENPRDFAAIVLGWDRSRVDSETDGGESHSVQLARKLPVHITYFTAWPDADGKIQYYKDVYGRDEAMQKAMASTSALGDSIRSQELVQN